MKTNQHKIILLGAAFLSALGTGFAQDSGHDWKFSATLPVWAAGLEGDLTTGGVTQSVDIGFSDLKEHLDASASLALEARKGPLTIFGSFGYLKFSADGPAPGGGSSQAESRFMVGDLCVGHAIYKSDSDLPFIVEAFGGARYINLKNSIDIYDGVGALLFSNENTRDLLDPIIGLRGTKLLTEQLHLDFAADIGGFDISDSQSNLDWSAIALVSYDFTDWFTLSGGYKVLAIDADNGKSGAAAFGADVKMSGAILAAKFTF